MMHRRMKLVIGCSVWVALALASGCSKGKEAEKKEAKTPTTADAEKVLARVGGKTIKQKDVDEARAQLPQYQQTEYQGARGTLRLVENLVSRELILKAAEDQGIERQPDVAKQMQDIRRSLLVQAYQRNLVDKQPKPTEEQIKAYYDQHPQEFVVPPRVNASWILCKTKADAEKARRRIVEKGAAFSDVAREVSIDEQTAKDGGLLGYFNPTGYVRSVGPDPNFTQHAFELEANDVGPVFEYKGNWAFIKVHERTSERTEPFDRAKERIRGRLTPSFSDSLMESDLAQLRKQYKVDILLDVDKELEGKSADDLMRLATEAPSAQDKIEYYRALLRKYPTYARADEAQFMIGFVYSEELNQFDKAKPEYEKVLQNYPQSAIRESAQYMIQNMGHGAPLPTFEEPAGTAPPGGGH